jgi:hypothetical protein
MDEVYESTQIFLQQMIHWFEDLSRLVDLIHYKALIVFLMELLRSERDFVRLEILQT